MGETGDFERRLSAAREAKQASAGSEAAELEAMRAAGRALLPELADAVQAVARDPRRVSHSEVLTIARSRGNRVWQLQLGHMHALVYTRRAWLRPYLFDGWAFGAVRISPKGLVSVAGEPPERFVERGLAYFQTPSGMTGFPVAQILHEGINAIVRYLTEPEAR